MLRRVPDRADVHHEEEREAMATAAPGFARNAAALALGVALIAGVAACGGSGDDTSGAATGPRDSTTTATRAPAPTSLTTGFDSVSLDDWSDHDRARVVPDAAHSARYGLDLQATASGAYVRWTPPEGHHFWSLRGYVRVVSWTEGESVDLFTVQNSNTTNNFDLFVTAPARAFQWDLFRQDTGRTGAPVELGRWYLVEAHGEFGADASQAEVRIDGVPQTAIRSVAQPAATVHDFVLGSIATAKTRRTQYDDVRLEVSDVPLDFPGPPAAQP